MRKNPGGELDLADDVRSRCKKILPFYPTAGETEKPPEKSAEGIHQKEDPRERSRLQATAGPAGMPTFAMTGARKTKNTGK